MSLPADLEEGPWRGRLDDPLSAWRLARLFDLLGRERHFLIVLYPATFSITTPPILRGSIQRVDLPYDSDRQRWEVVLYVVDQDHTPRVVHVTSDSFLVSPQEDGSCHIIFYRPPTDQQPPTLVLLAPPPTDSHGQDRPTGVS